MIPRTITASKPTSKLVCAADQGSTVLVSVLEGTAAAGLTRQKITRLPLERCSPNLVLISRSFFRRELDYCVTLVPRPSVSPRRKMNSGALGLGEGQGITIRSDCRAPSPAIGLGKSETAT